jgi:hypothetical protein
MSASSSPSAETLSNRDGSVLVILGYRSATGEFTPSRAGGSRTIRGRNVSARVDQLINRWIQGERARMGL